MAQTIQLRDSVNGRCGVVYDLQGIIQSLRERLRAAGALDRYPHLKAIGLYVDATFNELQVDALMNEIRSAMSAGEPIEGAEELIESLDALCDQVKRFGWYLFFMGK